MASHEIQDLRLLGSQVDSDVLYPKNVYTLSMAASHVVYYFSLLSK